MKCIDDARRVLTGGSTQLAYQASSIFKTSQYAACNAKTTAHSICASAVKSHGCTVAAALRRASTLRFTGLH